MWLFLAFVAVPLIEIGLFIQVGGWLGLWPTLGIVIATAGLGTLIVRRQGLEAVGNVRRNLDALEDPTQSLAHGALILFAAALLLTPGFFTDAVGFTLLVPGARRALISAVHSKLKARAAQAQQHPQGQRSVIIEGSYQEADAPSPPQEDGPSGWTRH